MMTDDELEYYLEAFQQRMDAVTDKYLGLIGQHVADIGALTPSDLHRVKQMRRMGKNIDEIEREIARVARLNVKDARRLLEQAAVSAYGDYASYGLATLATNTAMKAIVRAQIGQTVGAMSNLSNTTVVSDAYKNCIDTAINAVQTGVADYKSAIRSAIKEAAKEGVRVTYASGLTRRLDTSVRQNILDGTKQMAMAIARAVGEQFGADGVEISAHTDCAPDHLFLQGQQFSMKAFDHMQATLERPIGEWNCRHFAFPIILGISQPAHSKAELADLRAQTTERIEIDDVTKTRYQWTQKQRELETKARYAKAEANALKAAGDDIGRRNAQARINDIDRTYARISKEAGIPMRRERMQVAGFRRVKTMEQLPDERRYQNAAFASETLYRKHVEKHLMEYGGISEEEYLEKARNLLRSAPSNDILRLVRSDGSVSKYCVSLNEFASGTKEGKIRTAFKPADGLKYWDKELSRNG